MASQDEILDALADYSGRCNDNGKLRQMMRGWSRTVVFQASDTGDEFTMQVADGEIVATVVGGPGAADLVICATSEDLCDMFWGDLNPTRKYLDGEIVIRGAAADVMRIDAMSSFIWSD